MVKDCKDILGAINDYVTFNRETIRDEYNKVVDPLNRDNEDFDYELEIVNNYKKYLENEQYILKDIFMLDKYDNDDVNDKISLFQDIFQSFIKIEEIVAKFKRTKKNF